MLAKLHFLLGTSTLLNIIIQTLADCGWFDIKTPYEKQFHLTRGSSAYMLLTRGGVFDTYVKFTEYLDFSEEALRSQAAHLSYPDLTARFKGRAVASGVDMLVSQAVEFQTISKYNILNEARDLNCRNGLQQYFSSMALARIPSGVPTVKNVDLPNILRDYFDSHQLRAAAFRWLDQDWLDQSVSSLHSCPQHGDFVMNNIGINTSGLVLFDWEDFGRTQLPGLDLYSLLLSIGLGGVRRIQDYEGNNSQFPSFIKKLCLAMNLSEQTFETLIPFYLLTLLYLRREFGQSSLKRIETLLTEITFNRTKP